MKIVHSIIGVLTGLGVVAGTLLAPASASAAGTGTFLVSPTGGTYNQGSTFSVTIGENSGANDVDSARADLSYDAGALQVVGFSTAGNPFTTCVSSAGASGGSITTGDCTLLGGKKQGYQTLATVTFKVLAGSGSAALTFNGNSQLVNNGSDLSWSASNGTYSFATPSTSSSGSSSGSSSTGSSSSSNNSSSSSSSNTSASSNNSAVAGDNTAATADDSKAEVKADSTTKTDDSKKSDSTKKDDTKNASKKSSSKVWLWLAVVVILGVAAYLTTIRRPAEEEAKAETKTDDAPKSKNKNGKK